MVERIARGWADFQINSTDRLFHFSTSRKHRSYDNNEVKTCKSQKNKPHAQCKQQAAELDQKMHVKYNDECIVMWGKGGKIFALHD